MVNNNYLTVITMNNIKQSPAMITELAENEIFVFGSNLQGMHHGGAARLALKWGAVMGQGVGMQGQTYAIPTMSGSVNSIKPYVDEFIAFAKSQPTLKFLVTEIGCGIAGYIPQDIAPLFKDALEVNNIYLPERFLAILPQTAKCKSELGLAESTHEQQKHSESDIKSSRIQGSLIGGAVGDALGYTVEFSSLTGIKHLYGKNGITRYELDHRGLAIISDDTQMTLFTAVGLLYGITRGTMRGIMGPIECYVFDIGYRVWLRTQQYNSAADSIRDTSSIILSTVLG